MTIGNQKMKLWQSSFWLVPLLLLLNFSNLVIDLNSRLIVFMKMEQVTKSEFCIGNSTLQFRKWVPPGFSTLLFYSFVFPFINLKSTQQIRFTNLSIVFFFLFFFFLLLFLIFLNIFLPSFFFNCFFSLVFRNHNAFTLENNFFCLFFQRYILWFYLLLFITTIFYYCLLN